MKNFILIFICSLNAISSIGQNVGIGTDDPQEKLDVNGGIHSNSIHLESGSEEYRILVEGTGVGSLDQYIPIDSNDLSFYILNGGTGWQSFTAGKTGILSKVQLKHGGAAVSTMSIYEGEGTNGPLLGTVTFTASYGWNDSPPLYVPVVIGTKYTIWLSNIFYWQLNSGNYYQNGRSSMVEYMDLSFKTFVADPTAFTVDTNGNVRIEGGDLTFEDGNLGLGILDPLFKLHLSGADGKIRIDGGGGSTPYFSFGGEGELFIDAPNIPAGRLSIKNNGYTGIGIPSPSCKLDVSGQGKFSQGVGIGTSAPSGSLFLDVGGNARVSGRIGIGTSLPGSSLHIRTNEVGTTACGISASGGLGGNAMVEIRGNGGTPYLDFSNDSIVDYDGRLILVSDNRIHLDGADLYVVGNPVYATAFTVISDQRLKKDIEEVHFPISEIDAMKVYNYYYTDNDQAPSLPDALQTGLMAQEVEQVYPHAVITDSEGIKAIDYGKLTPLLLDYIKQLKTENEFQIKEFDNLKQDHDNLKQDHDNLKQDIEWIKKQL